MASDDEIDDLRHELKVEQQRVKRLGLLFEIDELILIFVAFGMMAGGNALFFRIVGFVLLAWVIVAGVRAAK